MAKISELNELPEFAGDETIPVVSDGVTRRSTLAALAGGVVPFLQNWYKGDQGVRGPQGYVAASIEQLRTAPTSDGAVALRQADGTSWYTWTLGNFVGQADDGKIIESQELPLSTGAWVAQSASTVSFRQGSAPFIRTRSALEKLREVGASVRDTGATGDGVADDTAAVQEIADFFASRGGEWHLPPGVFKTSSVVRIDASRPQRIIGRGQRGVYPGLYDPTANSDLAVILPVHAGRSAVEFVGPFASNTIELVGVALATLESGDVPEAAFAWDTAQGFDRNFFFRYCSIHGFTSAFDVFSSGGSNKEMGLFKAHFCNINRNLWIARTLDGTQWNGFSFEQNEAGQNGFLPGQGGIDISAHSVRIIGNALEGMRDPVRLFGSMLGASVRDNYFETNVGTAAIHLQNIRGAYDIGPNAFFDIDPIKLEHSVLLTNCGHGRALGPVWWDGVYKMDLPVLGNSAGGKDNILNPNVGTGTHGLLRMDGFDNGNTYTREPELGSIAKKRVTIVARELAPWNGLPMPVEEHVTSGSGALALNYAIAGAVGEFVVLCWLFKREPGAGGVADPYVSLSVNGNGSPGSKDYVANAFDENWRAGEWCLLTAAVKLEAAMTSLSVSLFPYGVNPGAGRRTRCLLPVVYTTNSPSKIVPYIDAYTAQSATAAPTAGNWRRGDRVANSQVAAAGQASFVCVADGTPGSWEYG